MRRLLLSAVLLILPVLPVTGREMDPLETRVSSGVFVKLDGRVTTVYLDFVTARYQAGQELATPIVLTTDIEVAIGDKKIPPGKHSWVITTGDEIVWTMGEPAKRRSAEVLTFPLDVSEAPEVGWLTACFQPDPDRGEVLLLVRMGRLQGVLRLGLEGATAVADGRGMNPVELRVLRDQLRSAAGILESARSPEPWSRVILELGDAILATDPGAAVTSLEFKDEKGTVELGVRGTLSGEREAADPLKASIEAGVIGRRFPQVSSPVVRRGGDGVLGFELSVRADAGEYRKTVVVPALFDGDKPEKLAEEVLLLEERIALLGQSSVATFEEWSPSLLAAKRKARVIVSDVESGRVMEEAEGLRAIPAKLTISGTGAGIARFLHTIESEGVPMHVKLDSMKAVKGGAEARLSLVFLYAPPLAMRRPDVLRQVRELGLTERFDRLRTLYLKGVGELEGSTFEDPHWERDPFAALPQ